MDELAVGEVGGMTWFKFTDIFWLWRAALAAVIMVLVGVESANAGPNEDFESGMVSHRRGDFATAMPALRRAADAGHVEAQTVLASILDAAEANEEAVAYYRKAAAAGNVDGIFGLASMLASGEGTKRDVQEARKLFARAAEAGHKQAVKVLAEAYIRGQLEISEGERKSKEALNWIVLAADDGFIVAMQTLEEAYRVGDYGLPIDVAKADALKQKIAKLIGVKERKNRRRGDKQ